MDNRGLNVGQSDVTSDYWQGDEAKWQKSYQGGADAIFVDEVEMDESTQTFQSQVSMPIVDPATGEVIGAITVGVNVDAQSASGSPKKIGREHVRTPVNNEQLVCRQL